MKSLMVFIVVLAGLVLGMSEAKWFDPNNPAYIKADSPAVVTPSKDAIKGEYLVCLDLADLHYNDFLAANTKNGRFPITIADLALKVKEQAIQECKLRYETSK